jgi:predicted ArsR family transcriptional regulator
MPTIVQHRLLADPIRVRLLETLAAADRPLGVRELAETVGRHPNSVREQLEQLVDAGLVTREVDRPSDRAIDRRTPASGTDAPAPERGPAAPATLAGRGEPGAEDRRTMPPDRPAEAPSARPPRRRGRPQHRYRLAPAGSELLRERLPSPPAVVEGRAAVEGPAAASAAYRDLARVLAEALGRLGGASTAELAGEIWGAALVGRRRGRTEPRRAVRRLVALLDGAGFAPEPTTRLDAPIRLRRCPFAPLARERGDVVCGVHLGMLRGALRAMAAPLEAAALEPFAGPDLCLVRLTPREGTRPPTEPRRG